MSGHVTNPSYFISFVKPAPAKLQTPGGTLWQLRTRVQRRPRVEASPRTRGISRLGRSVLPPRAERECDPAVALLHPLPPPDRVSRHPEDTDSSLGIQFRVAGTGHPAGSPGRHGTQRRRGLSDNQRMGIGLVVEQPEAYFGERLGCWTISKRETVGQFRVSEMLETVGQSQNLVRKTVRRFYGISFCRCIEVVGQSRSEKLKRQSTAGGETGLPPPYSFGWWPGKRARAPPDLNLLKVADIYLSKRKGYRFRLEKPKEMYPYPRVWALGREGVGYQWLNGSGTGPAPLRTTASSTRTAGKLVASEGSVTTVRGLSNCAPGRRVPQTLNGD
ncbi:hypothetical protein Bbelb_066400 [Branchiostoma belcheri]|nr:hypothetical protein Bbelb_066400 [Branchiostoma belcheri]